MHLSKWLERKKISKTSFAKMVDAPHSLVYAWADGALPGIEYMKKIERVTNKQVTLTDMYYGQRSRNQKGAG